MRRSSIHIFTHTSIQAHGHSSDSSALPQFLPPTHLLGRLVQDGEHVARQICDPDGHHRQPIGEVHVVKLQRLAVGCTKWVAKRTRWSASPPLRTTLCQSFSLATSSPSPPFPPRTSDHGAHDGRIDGLLAVPRERAKKARKLTLHLGPDLLLGHPLLERSARLLQVDLVVAL